MSQSLHLQLKELFAVGKAKLINYRTTETSEWHTDYNATTYDLVITIGTKEYQIATLRVRSWCNYRVSNLEQTVHELTTKARGHASFSWELNVPKLEEFESDFNFTNDEFQWAFNENVYKAAIDFAYYTHKKMPWFFKNGKVRVAKFRNFIRRANDSKTLYSYVLTQMYKDIKRLWDYFPFDYQVSLSEYCSWEETESGDEEFIILENRQELLVLLPDGTEEWKKVYAPHYRRIFSDTILQGMFSSKSISKATPRTASLTFKLRGEEYQVLVTEAEAAYLHTRYAICNHCHTLVGKEDILFGVCNHCSGVDHSHLTLRSYNARATEALTSCISPVGNPRLLGCELEYEVRGGKNLKEALFYLYNTIKDHAIFKRDGSLTDGIEICTRPASELIHVESFKKMFDNSDLMDYIEVKDTCGMHVHVDRSKLNMLTTGKLLKFMSTKANQSFIELVGERPANRYTKLGQDFKVTDASYRGIYDRYQGLNLTNSRTIEFRIFETPKEHDTLRKNLEFVTALVDYSSPANSGVNDTNWQSFASYLLKNRSQYKELNKFLKGVI